MSNHGAIINRSAVLFQLNEALESIHLSRSTLMDEDEEPAIWISLADILGHLCLAWHRKRIGPAEVAKESQEEYERKSDSVPNWSGNFQLVEFDASHSAVDCRLSRGKIDRDTVVTYLRASEAALHSLMRHVAAGLFDSCNISLFGAEFEPILRNLCLAWHLRCLSSAEISSLDPTRIKELGWWLPRWQWNLRLVPLDEEVT